MLNAKCQKPEARLFNVMMKIKVKGSFYKIVFFLLVFTPVCSYSQNNSFDEAVKKYIETFQRIAVEEMSIYHIPASITLAQGIFESNAGRSKLATEANNHFGIKCHKEWSGKKYIQDDETKNECFRKYNNPEESFRDHSLFLIQRDRYKSLFLLDITDYKGWARGLKEAGYATNPKYAELLINNIENYQLFQYDRTVLASMSRDSLSESKDTVGVKPDRRKPFEIVSEGPSKHTIYKINSLRLTIALKGDTWALLSKYFKIAQKKLIRYNDLDKGAQVNAGQLIFLEKKRKKGVSQKYIVKHGETMYTISQINGIQLKALYKLNKLKPGQSIKKGQKLILR